jgi:DNA-binding MarR family transcriptional regulator
VKHLGPGIKLKDISKHLMITAPSVTPIIKSLEGQGLIERTTDEKDKRAIRIRLTDKGESKINQTWDDFTNKYNELVIYLGEDKTKKLIEIQSEVLTYLNNKQEKT